MTLGGFHDDNLAELAAQTHQVVGKTQFTQVEGGGQASGVVLRNVYGHVTVPFRRTLGAGDLIRCESR